MIELLPSDSPIILGCQWNDPDQLMRELLGRLIHQAPTAEIDAGWLGFGIYDVPVKGKPSKIKDLMVGSQAVVGNIGMKDMSKYDLDGKKLGQGSVEKMDALRQTDTLTLSSIIIIIF